MTAVAHQWQESKSTSNTDSLRLRYPHSMSLLSSSVSILSVRGGITFAMLAICYELLRLISLLLNNNNASLVVSYEQSVLHLALMRFLRRHQDVYC